MNAQRELFIEPTDCQNGRHAALVDDLPRDLGGCVNVAHRCAVCQSVVTETSWTTDAWQKKFGAGGAAEDGR